MKIKYLKKIMLVVVSSAIAVAAYAGLMYNEEWVYYSDASKTQVVGGKIVDCYTGTDYWGQQTAYSKRLYKTECSGID